MVFCTHRKNLLPVGDSDPLAPITGSIAEGTYGIPQRILDKTLPYLDAPLEDVAIRWKAYMAAR